MRLQLARQARAALLIASLVGSVSADNAPSKVAGGVKKRASLEVSGYADTDHVDVLSPTIAVDVSDDVDGWSLGGRYLVDVVSAASVDIISNASGKWLEYRHVGSGNGSLKFDDITLGASGIVSREPDYLSLAGGMTAAVDLLDKNVTPFVGFSLSRDSVGRTGLPHEFWRQRETDALQLGMTFVVDRSTIASVQGDVVFERGYLAKPYRYVPLFAPGTGDTIPAGASVDLVNRERVDQRPAEELPTARGRFALSGRLAHRYAVSTLRLDERLYEDSWGVLASTSDLRYTYELSRRFSLWPHLRFHVQKQASFWHRAYELVPGPGGALGVPVFRTGDRELGPLYTGTVGIGTRFKLGDVARDTWALVLEADGGYTRYLDMLYISQRRSVLGTLAIEAAFE
jgi:Protein of unknown function (DUF3570)